MRVFIPVCHNRLWFRIPSGVYPGPGLGDNWVKIAISFFTGVAVCGLMLFAARPIIPTKAEDTASSDNGTFSLVDMLPDIEKIYTESLYAPFEKAESKIYDPDIAEFYRELLDNTGLRRPQPEEAE